MTITLLELTLILSGLVAAALALHSLRIAARERAALLRLGRNGELAALATHHLICATIRMLAGLLSCLGGLALLSLPNHTDTPSIIAKSCWLAYNWMMIVNLIMERRANRVVDRYSAHEEP